MKDRSDVEMARKLLLVESLAKRNGFKTNYQSDSITLYPCTKYTTELLTYNGKWYFDTFDAAYGFLTGMEVLSSVLHSRMGLTPDEVSNIISQKETMEALKKEHAKD